MNVKAISRNVGYALLVSALFMLLSIFVSVGHGNDSALAALIISFTITFTVGIFPFIFVKKTSEITMKDGYMITVLSWLLSFIFGMLPYALWGGPFTIENAWFESVSGFTTTGATILENVEALPASLLFWRSSTHFIGGLGVVVFLLLVIPNASPVRLRLTNMELSSLSKEGYNMRSNKIVYVFAYVYFALFFIAFISYMLAGMSPFDAVNHAFSVCATGGFSTRNTSIGAFDSRLIEGLTMLFMFLSSIHFGLVFFTVIGLSFKPLNNPVLKFYLCSIAFFSVYLAVVLKSNGIVASFGDALWNSTFETLCISTTTGFSTLDNSQWPPYAHLVFLFMGVMCGCAGSTTGGIKADRVLVLLKSVGVQIRKAVYPSSVATVKLGGQVMRDEDVAPHLIYVSIYTLILAVSASLVLLTGTSVQNAISASVASLGNVGQATGALGTFGNYNSLPDGAKILLTLDMFLGRVEIYPFLAVVAMLFKRNKKI